ncbi:hypothetical protein [Shewanella aquimarina]|uniref:hypothetical protein n=1 Tax=Shewanella aquimarina TaxID=260365 RepID=UPI002014BAC7|nr:hypothetical protein [Shewanella aquimarina]MCL2909820.1 hypothetical protein [Shewanella aquimarina]
MKTSPNNFLKHQASKHQASMATTDKASMAAPDKAAATEPNIATAPQTGSSFMQDYFEMDTGFALLQSMMRSKTLTIMVIIFLLAGAGFALFLLKMAAQY